MVNPKPTDTKLPPVQRLGGARRRAGWMRLGLRGEPRRVGDSWMQGSAGRGRMGVDASLDASRVDPQDAARHLASVPVRDALAVA